MKRTSKMILTSLLVFLLTVSSMGCTDSPPEPASAVTLITPTAEPTATGNIPVLDAYGALSRAVEYLRQHEGEDAPAVGQTWEEWDATPGCLDDTIFRRFTSDVWTVDVSYPLLPLENNTVYHVVASSVVGAWHWIGDITADGSVKELFPFQHISEERGRELRESGTVCPVPTSDGTKLLL